MNREDIFAFAKETFGTEPEYLWRRSPDSAVLRHSDNRKWYGLVMNVNRKSLGMEEDGYVEALNVKCATDMIDAVRMQEGILPGYHMNKDNWITIILDGTVSGEMVENLLETSYAITSSKNKGKRATGVRNTKWIIPANPKFFDVDAAFDADDIILWKQSNHICVGDTVYLYMGAPVSAIRYKCKAVEVDIPYQFENENLSIEKAMRIQKLQKYDDTPISFQLLKEYGVYAVRGPRSIPESLIQMIEQMYYDKKEK